MENSNDVQNTTNIGNEVLADVSSSKIMVHKNDFTIIQKIEIVEYFIWKCPHCGKDNKTIEYAVNNQKLFCSGCLKFIPYMWE